MSTAVVSPGTFVAVSMQVASLSLVGRLVKRINDLQTLSSEQARLLEKFWRRTLQTNALELSASEPSTSQGSRLTACMVQTKSAYPTSPRILIVIITIILIIIVIITITIIIAITLSNS